MTDGGLEIAPYSGVGPLTFGLSVEEVRDRLQLHVEIIERSDSGFPTDFFQELGIIVYYNRSGRTEAFEFGGPASPTFRGQYILGRSYREIERWLIATDPETSLDDAGLKSFGLGIGVYAPSAHKQPELPVEGVIIFAPDYYTKMHT